MAGSLIEGIEVSRYTKNNWVRKWPGLELYDVSNSGIRIGYLSSERARILFVWRTDINFNGILAVAQRFLDISLADSTDRASLDSENQANLMRTQVAFAISADGLAHVGDERFRLWEDNGYSLLKARRDSVGSFPLIAVQVLQPNSSTSYLVAMHAENPRLVPPDDGTRPEICFAIPRAPGWNTGLSDIVLETHAFRAELSENHILPENLTTAINKVAANYKAKSPA